MFPEFLRVFFSDICFFLVFRDVCSFFSYLRPFLIYRRRGGGFLAVWPSGKVEPSSLFFLLNCGEVRTVEGIVLGYTAFAGRWLRSSFLRLIEAFARSLSVFSCSLDACELRRRLWGSLINLWTVPSSHPYEAVALFFGAGVFFWCPENGSGFRFLSLAF